MMHRRTFLMGAALATVSSATPAWSEDIVQATGSLGLVVERAVALSEEKYCSVSATFREPVTIGTRIELVDSLAVEQGTGIV